MEPKLRDYVENLFAHAPRTKQAYELKEEIIRNTIDRYHDLVAEGKSEGEAYNLAIAGIGDINELLEVLGAEPLSEKQYSDEQLDAIKNRSTISRVIAEFDYSTIKNLHINWKSGSVNIKESTTDKIKIYEDAVSENDRMYYKLTGNGTLEIYDKKDFTLIGFEFNSKNKNLTVEVPHKALLYDTEVSAASANVEITDCCSQDMAIGTVSGNINVLNVKGTNLEIDTASGTVTAYKCDYSDIETNSVSGRTTINTYSTCESFEADSVSGEVEVFFENAYNNNRLVDCRLKKIGVNSVSGGVEVNLPTEIEGFTAELSSVSGAKIVNFNGAQYDDKTVYGNGKTDIDIETVSGRIEINKNEENDRKYE